MLGLVNGRGADFHREIGGYGRIAGGQTSERSSNRNGANLSVHCSPQ